jgi:isochorismate hydrolase
MPLLSSNSILLVLDMQNYFLLDSSHAFIPSAEAILPQIDKLIYYFEKKKRQFIFHNIGII